MKILAVDLGKVRTGLAVCDAMEMLAAPLQVITQTSREKLCTQIVAVAREQGVEQIILGHPLNMDGSQGESALSAQQFAQLLSEASSLPVLLRDERGTTISAHEALNVTDTRGKKRKAVVDAVAATILLQNYLDYRKNHPDNAGSSLS